MFNKFAGIFRRKRRLMETIINKIAESGIATLNLEKFLPAESDIAVFDLKPFLFREMILREKDFRASLPEYEWEQYRNKHVAVICTADAIIPMWAYMLVASMLGEIALSVFSGTGAKLSEKLLLDNINSMDLSEYQDKRVVIKGCGDIPLPESAFLAITYKLKPVVKSLMYGEPCSTVPVYKRKKEVN